jgi:hypothetical protein
MTMKPTVPVLLLIAMLASAPAVQSEPAGSDPPTPPPPGTPSTSSAPTPRPAGARGPRILQVNPSKGPMALFVREPREIDRKLSASPRGTVTIVNPAGSVVVTAWNENAVRVTGTLGGGVKKMIFVREDEEVNLQVVPRRNYPLGDRSDLEIQVPVGSRLTIKTFNASIEVAGVTGTIDMESMDGEIGVSGTPRQVHAECVSCDMNLNASAEIIRAENMKGTISVYNPKGLVELSTVSGSIKMDASKAGEITLKAVSGSISFRGNPGRNGSLMFQTHSGPIELTFPGTLSANFDILSYNGSIANDFVTASPARKRSGPRTFSTGSGGASVKIETFSGPIVVSKE